MSKVKTIYHCLLASALTVPLLNCGGSVHEPTEAYYLVAVNKKIPYWQAAADGLSQAATEMKVQSEMFGPDNYDPPAEKQEFQRVLRTRKPTGILVSAATTEILHEDIDRAIAQGVPVITMDSDAPSSKRLLFVGTDNYEAGRMGGDIVVKQLQGKGNVVIYTIAEQANLRERLHGYEEVFKLHPGIKVLEAIDMRGDPSIPFDRTTQFTEKKAPVDAYVCLEALACPEVAEVLNRNNLKGKVVVAMDTDPRTLDWVQKGLINATIAQKPFTMAYFGVKLLDMVHHQKVPSLTVNWSQDTRSPFPSFVDTGATLIDKSNVEIFQKANVAGR